jgi:small subunit ribosomal protein S3Ae
MADEEGAKKTPLARTVKDRWRSKVWFTIQAPGLFQRVALGETMATEPEQIVGRTIETTLQELSGGSDIGKAHVKLRFSIERVTNGNVAETRFTGHDLTSDYIRRLARRKRSKIDLSLRLTTKDGVAIQVKPVAVGEQRLQGNLQTELRHKIQSILEEEAAAKTAAVFVREMLQGELNRILANGVRTLYPLKKIEIRSSEVIGTIAEELPAAETPAPGPALESEEGPAVEPVASGSGDG